MGYLAEIPKGTVIKIADEIKVLTKGIKLAQKGKDLIVVDFNEITMKDDERLGDMMMNRLPEVTSKIPMPKVKPPKCDVDVEYKLLKLAMEVAENNNIADGSRKVAEDYLQQAFKKLKDDLIKDDKTD